MEVAYNSTQNEGDGRAMWHIWRRK